MEHAVVILSCPNGNRGTDYNSRIPRGHWHVGLCNEVCAEILLVPGDHFTNPPLAPPASSNFLGKCRKTNSRYLSSTSSLVPCQCKRCEAHTCKSICQSGSVNGLPGAV